MAVVTATPAPKASPIDPDSLGAVLAEIAETASETLELQDVFERVATAIRRLVPLDHMGVVRILEGEWAVIHATTIPCPEDGGKCTDPAPLTVWSPRLRPRPGPIARIDDAERELDPSFPVDAAILAGGVRSSLWEPFRSGVGFGGGIWASSYRPHAFTAEHQVGATVAIPIDDRGAGGVAGQDAVVYLALVLEGPRVGSCRNVAQEIGVDAVNEEVQPAVAVPIGEAELAAAALAREAVVQTQWFAVGVGEGALAGQEP